MTTRTNTNPVLETHNVFIQTRGHKAEKFLLEAGGSDRLQATQRTRTCSPVGGTVDPERLGCDSRGAASGRRHGPRGGIPSGRCFWLERVCVAAYLAIDPALLPHVDVGKLGRHGQGADVANEWQPRRPRGEARRSPLPQELAEHQREKQQEERARERSCTPLDSRRLQHGPELGC